MLSFEKLAMKIKKAEDDMKKALSEKYPRDCHVCVQLNSRQRVWSRGSVLGHDGQGYTRVRLFKGKEAIKNVYFDKIYRISR